MKNRAPTAMGQRPVWGIVETFHETSLQSGRMRYAPTILFSFAQFLVTLISQFRELLGLGEQLLGFGREGLQQAVVTDLAHDEVLELAPVGFLAVQVEAVLAGLFLGRVETPQVPVTALDGLGLFVLGTTHADLDAVVDTRSVADHQ